MNNVDNPYYNFLEIIKGDTKQQNSNIKMGEICNITPLVLKVGDITYERDEIKINADLNFNLNDSVLVVSLDEDNTQIIICKVR